MSKRNTVLASILSAFALTTLCLLSGVTAQKGPNSTAGAPIRSSDVKLGKNPGGGAAARTLHPYPNGKIDLSDLAPGSYWLEIPLSEEQRAANADGGYNYLAVTITGSRLLGGSRTRSFDLTKGQFVQPWPQSLTARQANAPSAVYTNRFEFEIGGEPGVDPTPLGLTIVKSKSNICNN